MKNAPLNQVASNQNLTVIFYDIDSLKGFVFDTNTQTCHRAIFEGIGVITKSSKPSVPLKVCLKAFAAILGDDTRAVSWGTGIKPFLNLVNRKLPDVG